MKYLQHILNYSIASRCCSDISFFFQLLEQHVKVSKYEMVTLLASDENIIQNNIPNLMTLLSSIVVLISYRFPRVFGDKIGDKFGDKLSDSPNLVKNVVTILVKNLVNHHILCQIQ